MRISMSVPEEQKVVVVDRIRKYLTGVGFQADEKDANAFEYDSGGVFGKITTVRIFTSGTGIDIYASSELNFPLPYTSLSEESGREVRDITTIPDVTLYGLPCEVGMEAEVS